jgi:hypothetical protein
MYNPRQKNPNKPKDRVYKNGTLFIVNVVTMQLMMINLVIFLIEKYCIHINCPIPLLTKYSNVSEFDN